MDGLDLPFQWDDGVCVSPFVASTELSMEMLAQWLDNPSRLGNTHTLAVTDLGCGNGSALLALSSALFKLRGEVRPLNLSIVGIDIDASLIEAAKQAAAAATTTMTTTIPSLHCFKCTFEVADLCQLVVEQYFPREEAAGHVLFLYLLPEALDIIRETLLEALQRVCFLVSNRWEVPFLSQWRVTSVGTLHIYSYGKFKGH
ncbi:CheR methyltransferase SAM binding domain [Trypanosoma vivax]|uniref:Methyltransferase domain-containing protein n=1 Tax=Trypanosoma vivax (strain Y486) TaxID=1055687 RepID=G0U0S8_TRYVY|nr:hypothetical protein TRVL_07534 [Trypanosoma vivax]KAH8608881.1 CheR methyltransferase SAM binding domain [Trypanosoma vivax]CCC49678.1 conserved hypothetical protein [Trypanosoma vivax Y486]